MKRGGIAMTVFENPLASAALYVALGLIWLLVLALAVVRARIAHKVTLGDGGVEAVQQASRAHGNAAEYLPAGLLGVLLLAMLPSAPVWTIHAAGGSLILGRVLHGMGLLGAPGRSFGRSAGILLTWLSFLFTAGALLFAALTPPA